MKNSMDIGCPRGKAARVNFVLKFSLLLLAMVFFCRGLHAQCDGLRRGLDEFRIASSCQRTDSGANAVVIDLSILGTTNASEIALTLLSEYNVSKIDSIRLEWIHPTAAEFPAPQLSWSQHASGARLDLDVVLEGCKPVFQEAFAFRIRVFFAKPPMDDWRLSTVFGGIVQVDVIQAKFAENETQRIYALDGTLLRETDRPLQSKPATEGLPPGIYLLRRMQGNEVTRCEKVLVW
jgi:hypothetical protein